jgi:predicted DsbA family dithiol-disulfide isomerase
MTIDVICPTCKKQREVLANLQTSFQCCRQRHSIAQNKKIIPIVTPEIKEEIKKEGELENNTKPLAVNEKVPEFIPEDVDLNFELENQTFSTKDLEEHYKYKCSCGAYFNELEDGRCPNCREILNG